MDIVAVIAARTYNPVATPLGDNKFRVVANNGPDFHLTEVLTITPEGLVTAIVTEAYTFEGVVTDAAGLAEMNVSEIEMGRFKLDSYMGYVFFDCIFG